MTRAAMIAELRRKGAHLSTVLEVLTNEQLAEVLEAFKVEERKGK